MEVREHPRRKDSARGSSLAPADTLPLRSCRASPSPATARHQRHGRGDGKADMLAVIEPPLSTLQTGRRAAPIGGAPIVDGPGAVSAAPSGATEDASGELQCTSHSGADRDGPAPAPTVARSTTSRCMARRPRVSEGGRDRPWAASGAGWRTVAGGGEVRGRIFCVVGESAPLGSLAHGRGV